jgi:hypothetical protein
LESQRVKLLLEGYLHGWLDFKYPQKTSRLRENLVIQHLETRGYEDALSHKLMLDSALIGGHQSKTKEMLNSLNKTYNLYLGLKLPDLAVKDTIEENSKISKQGLEDYKRLLDEMKKQTPQPENA